MSPFFFQEKVDLTKMISKLDQRTYRAKKYYRFAIGNDYPEDFHKMDSVLKKRIANPLLNIKGSRFKEADHNTTPGLLINTALYEIFEDWSAIQSKYISNQQKDLAIKPSLDQKVLANYGVKLNFSIGILNGKGWYFYNEKQYAKAIDAWQIMMNTYPNFSEGYLYMLKAQIQLKQNLTETVEKFRKSLANSQFYSADEKKDLETELQEILK